MKTILELRIEGKKKVIGVHIGYKYSLFFDDPKHLPQEGDFISIDESLIEDAEIRELVNQYQSDYFYRANRNHMTYGKHKLRILIILMEDDEYGRDILGEKK